MSWNRGALESIADLDARDYTSILHSISGLTGTRIKIKRREHVDSQREVAAPVLRRRMPTGWAVVAETGPGAERAAEVAAQVVGRMLDTESDADSLAKEVADRYEELNFLYETSNKVGALLDEQKICQFVIERAAWMLDCERASVMLYDRGRDALWIAASVGLPEHIRVGTIVRPGEGVSGRVLESARRIVVGKGDPLPADSLRSDELRDAPAFVSVPLKIVEQELEDVIGVLNLTRKRVGEMFTSSDMKLINAVAAQTATQIHNCRLLNAERKRRELEKELEIAARIQLSLLPRDPLRVGPLSAAGRCHTARHVGGDFYDYWHNQGRVSFLVADVSGHDLGAALMAAAFRSVVRSHYIHCKSPAELLTEVNSAFHEDLVKSELLITAFYAELSLNTGLLTFCRAGHPMPLLVAGERITYLDTEGQMLGLAKEGEFADQSLPLRGGERLVLYTDGLVEVQGPGDKLFGTERLMEAARNHSALSAEEMADALLEAAQHYGRDPVPRDDMTVLVASFQEE